MTGRWVAWSVVGLLAVLLAGMIGVLGWVFTGSGADQRPTTDPTETGAPQQPPAEPAPESDSLAGWAATISANTDIPPRAAQAYGHAEMVLETALPACHLSWNTLAGIAKVESNNGQFGGAALRADGTETKPIIGVPLDGSPGVRNLPAADHGQLTGDPVHDRAVGPLQLLPEIWHRYADPGADPQNIDAAALAAGRYLCAGGRDLRTANGWWAAILAYNNSADYANLVFRFADSYARATR